MCLFEKIEYHSYFYYLFLNYRFSCKKRLSHAFRHETDNLFDLITR